jgi:Uma2 family endonuclease
MQSPSQGIAAMSTDQAFDATTGPGPAAVPVVRLPPVELHSGDRMTRDEFHRLYEQAPESFKAELIGGIVYVASPLKLSHGRPHALLAAVLVAYVARTPGTQVSDNTTVLLGDDGEPQPDLFLRILPECGGQSTTTADDYIQGAPELIVELAHASHAIDLHAKKDMYATYGGLEYLVACLQEQQLRWFDLAGGKELNAGESDVIRVGVFPGLWINGPALFANDIAQMMATLEQGLRTPEHADFVRGLASRRS